MVVAIGIVLGFILGIGVKISWPYRRNLGEAMMIDLIESKFNQPHRLLSNITLKPLFGKSAGHWAGDGVDECRVQLADFLAAAKIG